MNAADEVIEEIREVRRQISAEFHHDINRYFAYLQELEKQYPEQIKRGKELMGKIEAERQKCPEAKNESGTNKEPS